MPSKSIAQQHLMQAAEHGADFPMAEKLRQSMSHSQLHDFAAGPMTGKPEHVPQPAAPSFSMAQPTAPPVGGSIITGDNVAPVNKQTFMGRGMNELEATKASLRVGKPRHGNLGKYLHPRKDGKPHGSPKMI